MKNENERSNNSSVSVTFLNLRLQDLPYRSAIFLRTFLRLSKVLARFAYSKQAAMQYLLSNRK